MVAVDGSGDVLFGEFVAGAGEGATEGDLDQPVGVEDTAGPAVSLAVTSFGWEEMSEDSCRATIKMTMILGIMVSYLNATFTSGVANFHTRRS